MTPEMNEELIQIFIEKEMATALHQMNPTKAPSPNGMAPIFYQKYWHIVGKDVLSAVLHALNFGKFPVDLNHTFITLISKKKKLEIVANYRLISRCNVSYKLISKVLANRLKAILPHVISSSQSAFKLLEKYEEASSQQVNRGKTSMVFSRNLCPGLQDELMSLWGHKTMNQSMAKGAIQTSDTTVDSLIDCDTNWWDLEKVKVVLQPRAATEVLKYLLTLGNNKDRLIWEKEKDGKYSEKVPTSYFVI
ncbi:uncharacterized protein LOC122293790 [Carya illinoinensis]|uniref:uncharacterized protein LOC122293790 n=1 Tax=Carya illinoinensis TaxID=32201 RepID=UPI001C724B0F|nr:uncharacterized protein LOC122293790 [Carya illinoinensis]